MKFSSEDQLVSKIGAKFGRKIAEVHKLKYKRSTIISKKEVSLGWGIADVVMSFVDNRRLSNKKSPILSLGTMTILDSMPIGKIVNLEYLSSISGIQKSVLKNKHLKMLAINNYVEFLEENTFVKVNELITGNEVIAIEAKLSDWKRALYQACRYKLFADLSYVVLDSTHTISAIKNLDSFRKFGVGLACIDTRGNIDIILEAPKQEPTSNRLKTIANEILLESVLVTNLDRSSNQSTHQDAYSQTYQQAVL